MPQRKRNKSNSVFNFFEQGMRFADVVIYSNTSKEIFPGSALPDNAMTEQQKITFPQLYQQLDGLMLRDKTRFARRLHGVKKVKNPDAQQAIYQEMAKEIEQAAGKVVLREAARPAITYPENLPVSRARLFLAAAIGQVIRNGLALMGVEPTHEMERA